MIEIYMNIFNKTICLHAENQSIIKDIINTFSFFIQEKACISIDLHIYVEKNTDNNYRIIYDEKVSACAKVNLYPKICDIIRRSLILKTNLFCFHAAAVEKDKKGFVFISSGNTGKSTLCTMLLFNGYKLLTDDTCWLDVSSDSILPYPLAIGTRHKTLELIPTLRNFAIETTFPGKLILPIEDKWVASQTKPFVYFLWELDFSISELQIIKIKNRELALNLLAHSFSYKYCKNKTEVFDNVLNAVSNSYCYYLRGNNLNALPQLLDKLTTDEGIV